MCTLDSTKIHDGMDFKQAIEELRTLGIPDGSIFLSLVAALGFKYWHENSSTQVNMIIEAKDSEYVRIHWNIFRASAIGIALYGDELKSYVDCVGVANFLWKFSGCITHRQFDCDNAMAISQLKDFVDTLHDKNAEKKFETLRQIYRRQIPRQSISMSE